MSEARWSPPVAASSEFTDEQRRRVQALRAAREVVEVKQAAKSPLTAGGVESDTKDLLLTAQWIVSGLQEAK